MSERIFAREEPMTADEMRLAEVLLITHILFTKTLVKAGALHPSAIDNEGKVVAKRDDVWNAARAYIGEDANV